MSVRTLTIEVPEVIARDLTAPKRWGESPTEARRRDAQEHVADAVRAELAKAPQAPVTTHSLRAIVSNVAGHVGHRVLLSTSSGVVTSLHCEDCNTEVPIA